MTVNSESTVYLDVDLKSKNADKFIFDDKNNLVVNDTLNVVANVVNNNIAYTAKSVKIPFINERYKNENLLNNVNITSTNSNINTPIYKYTLGYQNESDSLASNFVLTRNSTGTYRDYNPSIFAASVGAQVG